MKVVGINGSARKDGNTAILINYVFGELEKEGIDTDLVSPLILPSYTPEDVKIQQMARLGNIPARHSMLRSRFAPGERKTHLSNRPRG